jgi:hypothetical protein
VRVPLGHVAAVGGFGAAPGGSRVLDAAPIYTTGGDRGADCLLVGFAQVRGLLLSAKHLFYSAKARSSIQKMTARKRCFGVDFSTPGTSPLTSPKKHPHK